MSVSMLVYLVAENRFFWRSQVIFIMCCTLEIVLKPCTHKHSRHCRYVQLRKEDPKEIAKRLSEYVDEFYENADEYCLNNAEYYWADYEGLARDEHRSFKQRIAKIATDMRVEPEIEMIPILVQGYFDYLDKFNTRRDIAQHLIKLFLMRMGLHLHQKTIRLMRKDVREILASGVKPPAVNDKELDRKIRRFILANPRQRSSEIFDIEILDHRLQEL